MRAKTHVVAPARVTPIALPLRSATFWTSGATFRVKWLPSVWVAIILIGEPASRKTRMSVLPEMPTRHSPTITAFRRSGPPRKGMNSTARPSAGKKPRSRATMTGPAIEESPATAVPRLTEVRGADLDGGRGARYARDDGDRARGERASGESTARDGGHRGSPAPGGLDFHRARGDRTTS